MMVEAGTDKLEFICDRDREELIGESPVPATQLESVLSSLNLRVEERQLSDVRGWLDLFTGTVSVRRWMSTEKRVFTLAHELGHFRLHRLRFDLGLPIGELEEQEADVYAGTFLLPRHLLRSEWGFQELRWCRLRGIRPPGTLLDAILDGLAGKYRVPRWT